MVNSALVNSGKMSFKMDGDQYCSDKLLQSLLLDILQPHKWSATEHRLALLKHAEVVGLPIQWGDENLTGSNDSSLSCLPLLQSPTF